MVLERCGSLLFLKTHSEVDAVLHRTAEERRELRANNHGYLSNNLR